LAEARYTIDVAARLQPRSLDIQKLRLSLYEASGDRLGAIVAQDQVARLDPSLVGHEVFLGVDDIVFGVVAVYAIYELGKLGVYALTPPQDRHLYTMSLLADSRAVADLAIGVIVKAPKLGDLILPKA
jgi:hypothetical protein